jgi:hypothetical protein
MSNTAPLDQAGPSGSIWPSSPATLLSPGIHILENFLSSSDPLRSPASPKSLEESSQSPGGNNRDALLFLLPLLIVLSTFLFLILLFLVFVILLRKRRGISLRDGDGPTDLSREDLIEGEGGFDGVESRWLESVSEAERRTYLRARGIFYVCDGLISIMTVL